MHATLVLLLMSFLQSVQVGSGGVPRPALTEQEAAFHKSCGEGNLEEVQKAIDANVNVNSRAPGGGLGSTPLMQASVADHSKVVHLLIESGAEVDAINDNGATALHAAAMSGAWRSQNALMMHGATLDVKAEGLGGLTPLHLAVLQRQARVAFYFLEDGANPDIVTADGSTALHIAVRSRYPAMVRLLLSYSTAQKKDHNGQTPLDLAQHLKFAEIADILAKAPATQPRTGGAR